MCDNNNQERIKEKEKIFYIHFKKIELPIRVGLAVIIVGGLYSVDSHNSIIGQAILI